MNDIMAESVRMTGCGVLTMTLPSNFTGTITNPDGTVTKWKDGKRQFDPDNRVDGDGELRNVLIVNHRKGIFGDWKLDESQSTLRMMVQVLERLVIAAGRPSFESLLNHCKDLVARVNDRHGRDEGSDRVWTEAMLDWRLHEMWQLVQVMAMNTEGVRGAQRPAEGAFDHAALEQSRREHMYRHRREHYPIAYCPFCGEPSMCRNENARYYCINPECKPDPAKIDGTGKAQIGPMIGSAWAMTDRNIAKDLQKLTDQVLAENGIAVVREPIPDSPGWVDELVSELAKAESDDLPNPEYLKAENP